MSIEDTTPEPARTPPRRGLIVIGAGATGMEVARLTARVLPVTVLDLGLTYDELPAPLEGARFIRGDGTSLLVLREAGIHAAHALAAATSNDDVNIEACRLASACGVPEVLCRITDPARAAEARAVGAQVLTAPSAMAVAIADQLPDVVATTSEVGLGQGEILQVRVLPGSPVIGHAIRDVATREYLVAAIYRHGDLVVPHGDTVIEVDDQVLLVGHPDALRAVAEYYRLGGAQFPHQFGHTVMVWDPDGTADPALYDEAGWVRTVTRTMDFLRVANPPAPAVTEEPFPVELGVPARQGRRVPDAALEEVLSASPGLFVVPPASQSLFRERGMGALRSLMDVAPSPVLIARGSHPYQRILVAVGASESSFLGLELAVDIARLLEASITAVHVSPPQFIGGESAAAAADRVAERVEQLGRLYDVPLEFERRQGNPIREVLALCAQSQLLVLARKRNQTDTYIQPDVGLRMALGASCSALLLSRD